MGKYSEQISDESRQETSNSGLKISGLMEMNNENLLHNWKKFIMHTINHMDNSYDLGLEGNRTTKQVKKDGIINDIDQSNTKKDVMAILKKNFNDDAIMNIKNDFSDMCKSSLKGTSETTTSGSAGGFESPMGVIKKSVSNGMDEVTDSSSAGQYTQPRIWAKNSKNWRGNKKVYPGGKFVTIKEKCKTYPYCDEGPGSITLTDVPKYKLDSLFESVASKTNNNKDYVINVISKLYDIWEQ